MGATSVHLSVWLGSTSHWLFLFFFGKTCGMGLTTRADRRRRWLICFVFTRFQSYCSRRMPTRSLLFFWVLLCRVRRGRLYGVCREIEMWERTIDLLACTTAYNIYRINKGIIFGRRGTQKEAAFGPDEDRWRSIPTIATSIMDWNLTASRSVNSFLTSVPFGFLESFGTKNAKIVPNGKYLVGWI